MNLKLATLEHVALKQSMGMRFETEASLLRAFVKQMGDAVAVAKGTSKDVFRYLNGRKAGPVTLFWHRKHDALKGFWEFAILRLRTHVGVKRQNACYQPRLHDLRHTFAVHRLTAWYRTGADVQSLLPGLSLPIWATCA